MPADGCARDATRPGRIVELDALRGLAVIGIVAMNVIAFSMPNAAYFNPRAYGGTGAGELVGWTLSFLLVEDKFRALFAMMFGAGVAILLDRAKQHRLRAHYARMLVLFVIGFLHAVLLSSSDVLRLYALAGVVLPFVANWPVRRLLVAACLLIALHVVVAGYVAWGWVEYWWQVHTVPGTDPTPLAPAEYVFGADPAAIERGLAIGQESFGERIERRMQAPLSNLLAVVAILPLTLAAMLVGMAFWRNGLLAGRWSVARATRLGLKCAIIALPSLALLAALAFYSGFNAAVVAANTFVWSAPFDQLLAIAWATLAMALFQHLGARHGLVARLAASGKMALTNYLATSVVLGFLFFSWGLGWFGEVGRLQAYGLALVPIALMLVWSPLWLRYFRQGPAEWLWRSLAQMQRLPLKR